MFESEHTAALNGYAVVVPVGSAVVELERLADLLDAVCCFEPALRLCVLLDNSPVSRHLEREMASAPFEVISLVNPHRGAGHVLLGALCTGVLEALRTIVRRGMPDYVLRLDTDAMIIGPFDAAIRSFLAARPRAGIIGAVGRTCRRDWPGYGWESRVESSLIKVARSEHRLVRRLERTSAVYRFEDGQGTPVALADALRSLRALRPHILRAMENGYSSLEYCQGGAYAIAPEFLRRMARRGYLASCHHWAAMPVAEDVMIGMYARSVGLSVEDFSDVGQPFGTHFRGLGYSPPELLARRYAIVHSLRNNADWPEASIRRFFRSQRSASAHC